MNQIRIEEGIVLSIAPSHNFGDICYDQMNVVVRNSNGKESLLTLKYRHFDNNGYKVGDRVTCTGILRSYSEKVGNKNKVNIYVQTDFSYDDSQFDPSVDLYPSSAIVDGTICYMEPLRTLGSGKCNIHFILVNNTTAPGSTGNRLFNSYIPCIAWGGLAKKIAQHSVGDKILINDAELRSREYVKCIDDSEEIRLCHELYLKSYRDIEKEDGSNL